VTAADEGLAAVRRRMADAATRAGRDPGDVRLVGVTKGVEPERILAALAGERHVELGENKVQELIAKMRALEDGPLRITWHFVGSLQRNKARDVVGAVSLIHSVDSVRLAEAIARRARDRGVVQDVLLEVNTSGEPTKHGFAPDAAAAAATAVAGLEGIALKGLMTIAAQDGDPARACFALLRQLRDRIAARHDAVVELSMGMSGDFEAAIAEGATIVRIGTAIFGPRTRTPR
jgi:hypothetical protein